MNTFKIFFSECREDGGSEQCTSDGWYSLFQRRRSENGPHDLGRGSRKDLSLRRYHLSQMTKTRQPCHGHNRIPDKQQCVQRHGGGREEKASDIIFLCNCSLDTGLK